jgi:hypothetical protein
MVVVTSSLVGVLVFGFGLEVANSEMAMRGMGDEYREKDKSELGRGW